MNTSLFVGLCEDAGFRVKFSGGITHVCDTLGGCFADISEARVGDYHINQRGTLEERDKLISEIVPEYALTPIEGRE